MYKAKLVTGTGQITGSIAKIFSAGESGSTVNVFDDVKFGVHSPIGDGVVSSSFSLLTDNFTLPCGCYLDGPIAGFSLDSAGSVLVYFND